MSISDTEAELYQLDKLMVPLKDQAGRLQNEGWGTLPRTKQDQSLFFRQIERYADTRTQIENLPVARRHKGGVLTARPARASRLRARIALMKSEWLARKDSNLQSPDPESGALPFGHSPARRTGYQITARPPLGRPTLEPGTLVALGQARPPHLETPCPRSSTAPNAAR